MASGTSQRNRDALSSGESEQANRDTRNIDVPGLGLLKGLGVTIKHMFRPASTQQYPHVKPDLPPRTRGVIALMDENCTVCMLCSRECPDWCIYIDSHKETVPPAREGGRARTRNVLDRFAIDFALCMYCGICIEVCPFDALFWSPEFEYSEYAISGLLHEKDKLREWMDTVPAPPALDQGADVPTEVAGALETAERQLEQARQEAIEEQQEAAEDEPAAKKTAKKATATTAPKEEVHVEDAGEIDQETYDQLIAEGKSERIARAKAKAAYVRKRKKELRAQADAEGGAEGAPEAQQTAAPADADTQAEASPEADTTGEAAPEAAPEAEPAKKKSLADVHVEGAGEIDQEVFDQLMAEGKSERIARAKAKAAWVKKQKLKKLEEEDGGA